MSGPSPVVLDRGHQLHPEFGLAAVRKDLSGRDHRSAPFFVLFDFPTFLSDVEVQDEQWASPTAVHISNFVVQHRHITVCRSSIVLTGLHRLVSPRADHEDSRCGPGTPTSIGWTSMPMGGGVRFP